MKVEILSLFPGYFAGPFDESIIKRAREKGLLEISHTDVRDFALDKHRRVDDRPFGGGPGMVLKIEPLKAALDHVRQADSYVISLTPRGRPFSAESCKRLAKQSHLILIAGHYEGIDERIMADVDEEISIGDYVLTNGCIAAIVVIDAMARFLPGVLGDEDSAQTDSFQEGLLEHGQYTRPAYFKGSGVPEPLLGGDHAKIAAWRHKDALRKTFENREDLYVSYMGRGKRTTKAQLILEVQNLNESVRFYRKIMGFALVERDEERAFFHLDKERELVLVQGREGVTTACSIYRESIQDKSQFERMQKGIVAEVLKNKSVFYKAEDEKSFYCRDLDGHLWNIFYCNVEEK